MKIKLILTLEESIAEKARIYAKNNGRSLSELIKSYLESIPKESLNKKIPSKLSKITGAVKLPKDFEDKKVLRSNLEKKYL
jgi:hypothetical protein